MRREANLFVLVLTVIAPMLAVWMPSAAPAQEPTFGEVTVEVTCPADLDTGTVEIRITPWVATVAQGEDLEWTLTISGSDNDDIDVQPKSPSKWPYKKPHKPKKNKKQWKDMKPNQQGKEFFYNITVSCGGETVVIDPRVKVGGG